LADDNEMLRSLGATIQRCHGYGVLLAQDGQEAVEVYERERDKIALIVLDLTMPRLSGREALQRLRKINPQVRVLFSSGYSAEKLTEADRSHIQGFIAKPYRERDLVHAVQAALASPCS
jgi:CheY-like chemotaxis protein